MIHPRYVIKTINCKCRNLIILLIKIQQMQHCLGLTIVT